MPSYLSGKYWWLGVAALVAVTLIIFHGLKEQGPSAPRPPQKAVVTHVAKPKAVKPQQPLPTHPVLELFNPSAENISRDQSISRIRSELEQLLVITILLDHCAVISADERASVEAAGQRYAEHTRLFTSSASLMQELLAQAERTYELVYASTRCSEPSLQTLKAQTLDWQRQFQPTPQ